MINDYKKGNYTAYYTWQGYIIQRTDDNGKHHYLTKVYRGKYTFYTDYTYAKAFRRLETAQKHIDILIDQEAKQCE